MPSPTLREAAGNRIFVGAAVNYGYLTNHVSPPLEPTDVENYTSIVASDFSIITAENALKMKGTEAAGKGVFNFTAGNAVVGFARAHNVSIRGHNLVWVAHNPTWLVSSAKRMSATDLDSIMKEHIEGVVSNYKGQVYSWDVVNEAMVDVPKVHICGNWTCALKNSAQSGEAVDWTKAGDKNTSYIEKAFKYAHAVDPEARLFYNDYVSLVFLSHLHCFHCF